MQEAALASTKGCQNEQKLSGALWNITEPKLNSLQNQTLIFPFELSQEMKTYQSSAGRLTAALFSCRKSLQFRLVISKHHVHPAKLSSQVLKSSAWQYCNNITTCDARWRFNKNTKPNVLWNCLLVFFLFGKEHLIVSLTQRQSSDLGLSRTVSQNTCSSFLLLLSGSTLLAWCFSIYCISMLCFFLIHNAHDGSPCKQDICVHYRHQRAAPRTFGACTSSKTLSPGFC